MCLSELQARLNVGQPLFPTHALCIRRSQQHRSPPAGIDFRGAFRILNIRGLTLSGTKTHVKQRFLPLTPLLMVSDVLWSPVLPA